MSDLEKKIRPRVAGNKDEPLSAGSINAFFCLVLAEDGPAHLKTSDRQCSDTAVLALQLDDRNVEAEFCLACIQITG